MNDFVYYERWFRRIFDSMFVYENVPDTIDIDFFNWYLNHSGYITGVKADDGTLRVLQGAISGIDVYNRATDFQSANPVNKYSGLKRKIGENCVVFYNTLNRRRAQPNTALFRKYADLFAEIDKSINCAIMNTRVSTIYNVSDDKEAQKIRAMCDRIAFGEPFIVTDAKLTQAILSGSTTPIAESIPVRNNYVLDMLLRDRYTIFCNFLTEIGINNTPFEKKERQIIEEVQSNDELLGITNWQYLKARKDGWDAFNEMFGTDVTVRFNREEVNNTLSLLKEGATDAMEADV